MILGNTELSTGAKHPSGNLAADLAFGDLNTREFRTHPGERDPVPHREVLRSTYDPLFLLIRPADVDEQQGVRVRVLNDVENLGDHDAFDLGPRSLHRLDLHAGEVEDVLELLGRYVDVDVLLQPAEREPHAGPLN